MTTETDTPQWHVRDNDHLIRGDGWQLRFEDGSGARDRGWWLLDHHDKALGHNPAVGPYGESLAAQWANQEIKEHLAGPSDLPAMTTEPPAQDRSEWTAQQWAAHIDQKYHLSFRATVEIKEALESYAAARVRQAVTKAVEEEREYRRKHR